MTDVTQILSAMEQGDPQAAERLLPLVYDELRRLAARRLAQEKPGQTLQATALVHEAYLRLVGGDPDRRWDGRGHFFAAAAEAMRRILVENARSKARQKRGGGLRRVDLADQAGPRSGRGPPRPRRRPEPAGGRRPGRGEGGRTPPVRRAGSRGGRGRPRHHRLPRPPEMGLRPGLAPRRPRRLIDRSRSRERRREGWTRFEDHSMPLDPKRVQAVFGAAIECDAAADRAAVLDRECSTDRGAAAAGRGAPGAHDQADSLLDRPIVGPAGHGIAPRARPEDRPRAHARPSRPSAPPRLRPDDRPPVPTPTPPAPAVPPSERTNRVVPAIAGYEILGELGRGGMGVVYQARQVRLNRPCVLKMILAGAHAGAEAVVRFLAEAEAVARLQHPQHRPDPPHRRGRRPAVLRAGVRRRRQPGPAARRHALAAAAGGRAGRVAGAAASPRRTGWASSTAT